MQFRRWVVFTFLVHVLVVILDKGAGFVLYLLTRNVEEEHGRASILAALPFILMALANLGLATSLVYHVKRRIYTVRDAVETTTFVALVWGGIVGLGAAAVTLWFLPLLDPNWVFDPWLVVPFCAAVPVLLLSSYCNSIQLASDRVRDYSLVHLFNSMLFLPAFFLCFWVAGGSAEQGDVPMGVAWGRLVAVTLVAILTLWMVRDLVRVRPRLHWDFLKDNLRYGWRANLTSVLTYLNHRVDLLVLGALYMPAGVQGWSRVRDEKLDEVAFYSLAVSFAELVWHFPEAMRDLFFSKVAGSSHEQARAITPVLCRLGLLVSLAGGVLVALLVDPLMGAVTRMMDGPDNNWVRTWSEPVCSAILLLVPGTVGYTVAKILQSDLAARNHLRECVNACTVVLMVMLALDIVLIPEMGADGAAIASSVAYLVSSAYTLQAYVKTTGTPMRECLFPRRSDGYYLRQILSSVWEKVRRRKK